MDVIMKLRPTSPWTSFVDDCKMKFFSNIIKKQSVQSVVRWTEKKQFPTVLVKFKAFIKMLTFPETYQDRLKKCILLSYFSNGLVYGIVVSYMAYLTIHI